MPPPMHRYVLKLFLSLKYITANVIDRNTGRIVVTASTVEHAIKSSMECGRTCNTKAATAIGEVLGMRLKVEGLEKGGGDGRGVWVDVRKEMERKGMGSKGKVWGVVNGMRSCGVKVVVEDEGEEEDWRSSCW
ncbi:hypothetical protein Droror1_Dr00019572 [Drosera rotundifolia]